MAALSLSLRAQSQQSNSIDYVDVFTVGKVVETSVERSIAIPQQNLTPDKIIRTPIGKTAPRQDGGTHLGYVNQDKLSYAVFQFENAPTPVATLVGWVNSNDYYPHIVVPDNVTYDGKSIPVTTINNYAFSYGWGITGLTIGKNVITIGYLAFCGCSIKELEIPVSVRLIDQSAFNRCPLTSLTFENASSTENPLVIGMEAFSFTKLKSVEIPARLKLYDISSFLYYLYNPFRGTETLESITVNPNYNNQDYTLEIYQGALCSRHKLADSSIEYLYVLAYPSARVLDEFNVTADFIVVSGYAFQGANIGKISLTSTLKEREGKINMNLRPYAFIYSSITSLNLTADGPIAIYSGCGAGSMNLTAYTLSKSISNYEDVDGVVYSKGFEERYLINYPCGRKDASFTIPSDVAHLDIECFNSNPYIKEVTLPLRLKSIGNYAFVRCLNLERLIYTGTGLEKIGAGAFNDSKIISSATPGEVTLGKWLIGYSGDVPKNLVISDKVNKAMPGVFSENSEIASVAFPKDFENIPDDMFQYCGYLKSVQFSENLRTIGNYAFYMAGHATSQSSLRMNEDSKLIIPEGVTEIGEGAFSNSHFANKLVLPASIEYLDNYSLEADFTEVEIHRSTPPTHKEDFYGYEIFSKGTLAYGTLIIPKDADPLAFKENKDWNFTTIINGNFNGVDAVEQTDSDIVISFGSISSVNGEPFTLYAADGREIGTGSYFTDLTPGIYILRIGTKTNKYAIK